MLVKNFSVLYIKSSRGESLVLRLTAAECALLLLNEAFLFSIKFIIYHTS